MRKDQLKVLLPRHKEILRRALLGEKSIQIAKDLGVCEHTVCRVLNSDLGQAELERMMEERDAKAADVQQQLKDLAPEALGVVAEIMRDREASKALRLRAAQDLLSRAGFVAPLRVEPEREPHGLTGEEIEALKERAKRAGIAVPYLKEVKPSEEPPAS